MQSSGHLARGLSVARRRGAELVSCHVDPGRLPLGDNELMPRQTRPPTDEERVLFAERLQIDGDFSFIVGWDPRPGWLPETRMTSGNMDRVDCLRWVMGSLTSPKPIEKWPADPVACYAFLDEKLSKWKRQPPPPPKDGEVIALYVREGRPTHVAIRSSDGRWESKLGYEPAIVHDRLELLETKYGQVLHYYVRKKQPTGGRGRQRKA